MFSKPKTEMNKVDDNYYCLKCGCTFQLLKDFYKIYRFKSNRQINKLKRYHFTEINVLSIYRENKIYKNKNI